MTPAATPIRVLLIEDNPGDARLIREMLRDAGGALAAVELANADRLAVGLERLANHGTDVVLLDLQYAPLVTLTSRYERMEKLITNVAAEQRVGHFPRFVMMKRAIDAGVSGLVSWDGLHNSSEGYACVGVALARMIDAAAR